MNLEDMAQILREHDYTVIEPTDTQTEEELIKQAKITHLETGVMIATAEKMGEALGISTIRAHKWCLDKEVY